MKQPNTNQTNKNAFSSRFGLLFAAVLFVAFAVGVGAFAFVYGRGGSYFTNDPQACVNCHIMREQYDNWQKSSHHAVAVCNDCHTPSGWLSKYVTKAENGFWHSLAFTTQRFHEPIQIKKGNLKVAEQSCRNCHQPLLESMDNPTHRGETSCIRCHGSVGHR